jgi:hypothetical protein
MSVRMFVLCVVAVLTMSACLPGIGGTIVTPGLYEGRVAGALHTTTPNPNTSIVLSTRYANIQDASPYPNTLGAWADNSTFVYSGYINNASSSPVTWILGENFDDSVWLSIDGVTLLNNVQWNVQTTAPYALTAGWHPFELRLGQGAGEVGPGHFLEGTFGVDGQGLGVGYNTGSGWRPFTDDGSGSFLSATNPVPEPSAMALLGMAAAGLALQTWRKHKTAETSRNSRIAMVCRL